MSTSSTEEQCEPERPYKLGMGGSPWDHSVALYEGKLALYWKQVNLETKEQETFIRTFTNDETVDLLEFLYQHRDEIMKH
jgi:hypothetical protein